MTNPMFIYAVMMKKVVGGTVTHSNTLGWTREHANEDEVRGYATRNALDLKPDMGVVDILVMEVKS